MCFRFYCFIVLSTLLIFNSACSIHHSSIGKAKVTSIAKSNVTCELQHNSPTIYLLKMDISKELFVIEHQHLKKLFKVPWKVDNENWILEDKATHMDVFSEFLVLKTKNG